MNEQEWLTCTDVTLLIKHLRTRGQDRKLRLFACACARRLWDLLPVSPGREAVVVAERFADGDASAKALAEVYSRGIKVWSEAKHACDSLLTGGMGVAVADASQAALYIAIHAAKVRFPAGTPNRRSAQAVERTAQLAAIHDIFGNPFQSVSVDPSWRSSITVAIAQTIYDERRFEDLPIMADALEEAGCQNAEILTHCRQHTEHTRGCWVLDLLCGKT
jgi:hypothetical protein